MSSVFRGGTLELVSDLFRVLTVPGMGRGLFAVHDLPARTIVLHESPLVSTPPVSKVRDSSWCATCCSPGIACGHDQADVDVDVDLTPLLDYCEAKNFKWPLLIAKLASRHLRRQRHQKEEQHDETLARMKFLCSVDLEARAHHLEEQRQVMMKCFTGAHAASASDLSIEWYVDTYSRIQPNAFRLDLIDTQALQGDYHAVLRAMLARQEGDQGGSAVYTVASLINHSCAPNVDVSFAGNDHDITLRTNQDVRANEQLTISYIDGSLDAHERARQLAMYGFTCECERCREERD